MGRGRAYITRRAFTHTNVGTYCKRPKRQDFSFRVPRDQDTVVNVVSDSSTDEDEEESDAESDDESESDDDGAATPRKRVKKESSKLSNQEEEEFAQLVRKAESARARAKAMKKSQPVAAKAKAGGGKGLMKMTPNAALDMYAQLTGGVANDDTHLRLGSPARPALVKRPPAKQSMYMSDNLCVAQTLTPEMNAALMQVRLRVTHRTPYVWIRTTARRPKNRVCSAGRRLCLAPGANPGVLSCKAEGARRV